MCSSCFVLLIGGLTFLETNFVSPDILFHWKKYIKQEAENRGIITKDTFVEDLEGAEIGVNT